MRIDVLTLFPLMFESPLGCSILKRAQEVSLVEIALTDIRDFAADSYRKVDDKPYGGGPGMVMMPGPTGKGPRHPPYPTGTKIRPEKSRRAKQRKTPNPNRRQV